MASPDFYKTLGVSREATADEIRKAYKKLARENHPDSKPGDEQAAARFKEVQEAYAVLGDAEKREQYDRYGAAFRDGGRGPFQQSWGGGAGPIDLSDLFGGGVDFSDLFGGGAGRPGGGAFHGQRQQARPQKGEDVRLEIEVPFQIAALGGSHSVSLNRGDKSERITVKIPAGVDTGSVIRLAGEGHPGQHGGPQGDLKLTVKASPHPWFKRDGANLLLDVPITPTEAALGAKVNVPTLSEGNVSLTIPPGTSSGSKLRLRGKGAMNQKTREPGDQLVVIKIEVPKDLTDDAKELYRQLGEASPQSPRAGLW